MFVVLNEVSNVSQVWMRIEIQWYLSIEKITHFYTKHNYHVRQNILNIFKYYWFTRHWYLFNIFIRFRAIRIIFLTIYLLSRFIIRVLKVCEQEHNQYQAIGDWVSFSPQCLTENQEAPHKLSHYITWKILMICNILKSSGYVHFHHEKT